LAEGLAGIAGLAVDLAAVETNIVLADLGPRLPTAAEAVLRLGSAGVLCLAVGPRRLRFVTHLDVDAAACRRAVDIAHRALA